MKYKTIYVYIYLYNRSSLNNQIRKPKKNLIEIISIIKTMTS